ncbi:unnamed protein product [Phytophthora lilii]|uniref:Unnamed protein product n=1 Tax=Phytophthora lilii TaxID=2077276 RepID=A0A9W6YKQ4_9STRA|nr:unnamed protein product [Phytophthora lilii]
MYIVGSTLFFLHSSEYLTRSSVQSPSDLSRIVSVSELVLGDDAMVKACHWSLEMVGTLSENGANQEEVVNAVECVVHLAADPRNRGEPDSQEGNQSDFTEEVHPRIMALFAANSTVKTRQRVVGPFILSDPRPIVPEAVEEGRHNGDDTDPAVVLDTIGIRDVEEFHPHAVAGGRQEEERHVVDAHKAECQRDHLQVELKIELPSSLVHLLHSMDVVVVEHVHVPTNQEKQEQEFT